MNTEEQKPNPAPTKSCRPIAFYLPQYHQIPENDKWWGKGFTEWTNVAKAKPLYHGHYQPRIPADLGFYNLCVPETRAAQAELAKAHGVEGFCYWHYWFAGKRLLERPFNEVLSSGKPDFPFCLAWANESWTGIWYGAPDRTLMAQTYPGEADHESHFYTLLKAFSDPRYITVDKKPVFFIYKPFKLPDSERVFDQWRELALKAGLKGLHLIAILESQEYPAWNPIDHGYDGFTISNQSAILRVAPKNIAKRLWRKLTDNPKFQVFYRDILGRPVRVRTYSEALPHFLLNKERVDDIAKQSYYPCVIPDWDNTPRCGLEGLILDNATPELFSEQVSNAVNIVAHRDEDHRLLIIKSWNEWAEGNYLEPDQRFGTAYLEALKRQVITG